MVKFEVDPRKVFYSQDSIRATFQNDEPIEDTIEKLVSGEILPSKIRCMRVCTLNGKMHSLDNRRLYAFKEAINRGSRFRTVTVIRSEDYFDLENKMSKSPKNFDWSKIRIRGSVPTRKSGLHVNSVPTRTPSLHVNSVPTRTPSLHVNSVPTRTPSLHVNSVPTRKSVNSVPIRAPSLRVNSVPTRTPSLSHTRIQDMPSIYSVPTKTQNRHSLIYMDSLHTRTQDSSSIYVNSNFYTGTQGRPNTYVNSLPTRKSTVTGFGDDDYASSSCCVIA